MYSYALTHECMRETTIFMVSGAWTTRTMSMPLCIALTAFFEVGRCLLEVIRHYTVQHLLLSKTNY